MQTEWGVPEGLPVGRGAAGDWNADDEVGLFSYWQSHVVCCIFHLESRVLSLMLSYLQKWLSNAKE